MADGAGDTVVETVGEIPPPEFNGSDVPQEDPQQVQEDAVKDAEPVADTDSGVAADDAVDDEESEEEKPYVELFVKAHRDRLKLGSCPICQRYFMVFYLLRDEGLIDLAVTTFAPDNPPPEVLAISNGKHFPLLKVNKGFDHKGVPFDNTECDTVDEIENVILRFNSPTVASRQYSAEEDTAEKSFDLLYPKFNFFLKDRKDEPTALIKVLGRLDGYLRDVYTKNMWDKDGRKGIFMRGPDLTRADCQIMPVLQHIRVAGNAYKGFDIPEDYIYVWMYLGFAYETEAFKKSCPCNAEIIRHYFGKASCNPRKGFPSKSDEEDRNMAIPDNIRQMCEEYLDRS